MLRGLPLILALLMSPSQAPAFPVPKPERVTPNVTGTTWAGITRWGSGHPDQEYLITFQADGVLVYHPDTKCNGRWKQVGDRVFWDINGYSHYEGRIEGNSFRGTGSNNAHQNATFTFHKHGG